VDCHGCTNALIITNTDAHGTPVDPNSAHKVNTSSYCPPTVDTVVCRTNGASFTSPGENHPIGTQLVELSLCSNGCPITCGAATYKIKVTADGAQPTGSTTFTATSFSPSLSGTTSLTHFPVNYKVELIRCDQPGSLSPVTGSIDFVQHNGGFSKNVNGSMSSVWQQAVLGGLLITLTAWFLVARRRRVGGEEAS
jgi:hypothetical protein